jgi:hypothetical protein
LCQGLYLTDDGDDYVDDNYDDERDNRYGDNDNNSDKNNNNNNDYNDGDILAGAADLHDDPAAGVHGERGGEVRPRSQVSHQTYLKGMPLKIL